MNFKTFANELNPERDCSGLRRAGPLLPRAPSSRQQGVPGQSGTWRSVPRRTKAGVSSAYDAETYHGQHTHSQVVPRPRPPGRARIGHESELTIQNLKSVYLYPVCNDWSYKVSAITGGHYLVAL